MKTNEKFEHTTRQKQPMKQANEPESHRKTSSVKKQVNIKDMPQVDGARPGII